MDRSTLASLSLFAGALFLAAGAACGAPEDDAESDTANITEGESCEMFIVKDQKFVDLKTFVSDPSRANDHVVQKILKPVAEGKGPCPTSYTEIQKSTALQKCGLQTRIISERSMLLRGPDIGRAVISRACDKPETPSIFFAVDPLHLDKDLIPPDVELISNDSTTGIFSFYAREPKTGPRNAFDPKEDMKQPSIWKFYGTSVDFVTNGYDCDPKKFHGACQSKFAQDGNGNASGVRCASCHPGGGMVQKELNSPWTYWQDDPGDYTAKHKASYGEFQPGVEFEQMTQSNNLKWNDKRIEVLAKKSVKELLRPVFCTMDVNLQSGSNGEPGQAMITQDLLLDSHFDLGGATPIIVMDLTSYAGGRTSVNQVMKGDPAFPAGKKFDDTPDPFMYPERSAIDNGYVSQLVAAGKIGLDFAMDILFVDFSRPIYSSMRCSLVDLADGVTDSTKAKAEILKKLQAMPSRTPAQEEFLASLQLADKSTTVSTYAKACVDRKATDPAGLAKDMVKYAANLRELTRQMKVKLKVERHELGIIDFEETLPFSSLSDKPIVEMRLNPKTCILEQK